jgi:Na+-transporting methylmalonyl-CoA/oxaloacetate decarboxylase gamma subunit
MEFADAFSFVLYGLATVLGTLTLLALLCGAMGRCIVWWEARRQHDRESAVVDAAQAAQVDRDVISPELLVVLTAAAESALGASVRVAHIESTEPRRWAHSGRETEHMQHWLR